MTLDCWGSEIGLAAPRQACHKAAGLQCRNCRDTPSKCSATARRLVMLHRSSTLSVLKSSGTADRALPKD